MEKAASETVVVASTNPVKISAARCGLELAFPELHFLVEGVGVDVDIPAQPMDDVTTRRGARLRVEAARAARPDAAFWVGMEGGIHPDEDGRLFAFAWIAVAHAGAERRDAKALGESRTAHFELPPAVARLVREGMELGHADDAVFGQDGSKRASGAVGLLTGDVIDRAGLYWPAVVLACIPHLRPDLYH